MKRLCITAFALLLALSGCEKAGQASANGAFYLRETVYGPKWVQTAFTPSSADLDDQCMEVLSALQNPPNGLSAALPSGVRTLSLRVVGNVVYVDFSEEYANLSAGNRSIACAAVVHSLLQLKGLFYISVTAVGEPQSPMYERYCTIGTFMLE